MRGEGRLRRVGAVAGVVLGGPREQRLGIGRVAGATTTGAGDVGAGGGRSPRRIRSATACRGSETGRPSSSAASRSHAAWEASAPAGSPARHWAMTSRSWLDSRGGRGRAGGGPARWCGAWRRAAPRPPAAPAGGRRAGAVGCARSPPTARTPGRRRGRARSAARPRTRPAPPPRRGRPPWPSPRPGRRAGRTGGRRPGRGPRRRTRRCPARSPAVARPPAAGSTGAPGGCPGPGSRPPAARTGPRGARATGARWRSPVGRAGRRSAGCAGRSRRRRTSGPRLRGSGGRTRRRRGPTLLQSS